MGGSSRKKQTQDSTQTFAPPAWARPLFEQGAKQAQDLYNSGAGGNVYQGQRVADLSEASRGGLDTLGQAAAGFGRLAGANGLGQPTAAQSNLSDIASGKYLREGSPYYQDRLNSAIDQMSAKVNSQMSGAGRYGSGANSDILAKNAGSMLLSGLDNDYGRAMGNMLSANSQIDAANQGAVNSAGNYLRGWSSAGAAQMLGGRAADANNQARLDAARDKWDEQDNSGWRRLGYLQDAAKGFAGPYGTQTGHNVTTQKERGNPWTLGSGMLGGLGRKI